MRLTCKADHFDLDPGVCYLNMAYQSPLLRSSIAAGIEGVRRKTNPYKMSAADFFEPLEQVKRLFAQLIGCNDPQNIAYQPSVSYGIANVAQNLPRTAGAEIVILDQQFPSNTYAYLALAEAHGLKVVQVAQPAPFEHDRPQKWNERVLEAIGSNTVCVSIPQCHWADGTCFDLRTIRGRCDEVGALMVIDGTQSIGALNFDVQEIRPDALICATYKWLLGPYGSCLSFYGERLVSGTPIEYSWMNRIGSDRFDQLANYQPQYRKGANRYTVGESANFIALPMIKDALQQVLHWTAGGIQDYCREISQAVFRDLDRDRYHVDEKSEVRHLFGIRPLDREAAQVHQLLQASDVHVSLRGECLRISPYLYNTASDFQRLLENL